MSTLPTGRGDHQGRPHGSSPFDAIRHTDEDERGEFEWWSARELMTLLDYGRWERFEDAIDRAKAACRNSGYQVADHFRNAAKMVQLGSGATREVADVQLSRFGAYLVAMNGDSRKRAIAVAQQYFAIQTRRAELLLPPSPVAVAEPSPMLRPWGERLSATIQKHRLYIVQNFPAGSFSTYVATSVEILMIEDELLRHRMPLRYGDLPDGSIGQRWSNHRKQNNWPDSIGQAPLEMPHLGQDGSPLIVMPYVYGADERPRFDEWLNAVYIPQCMPEYFEKKKNWRDVRLPVASAAEQASLRLTGQHAALSERRRSELVSAGGRVIAPPPPRQLSSQ
jgi:hypothetical protein